MKNLKLIIFFLSLTLYASAQKLSPASVATQGSYNLAGGYALSWSAGETFTPTLRAGALMLSQGLQQPEVEVLTGAIAGTTLFNGAPVQVPFTAFGIMDTNNVFTAQLSDASGNFTSPFMIGSSTGRYSNSISARIPYSIPAGSNYRVRVVSSNPVYTGKPFNMNLAIAEPANSALNFSTGSPMVTIAEQPLIDFDYTTSATIEMWIKPNDAWYGSTMISKRIGCDWYNNTFQITYTDYEGLMFGNDFGTIYTGYYPKADQWTHIAFAYDASSGSTSVYLNGCLFNTYQHPLFAGNTDAPLAIGRLTGCESTPYVGDIDEIRIWNYPRTAEEIVDHINTFTDPQENPGLIAYYTMNQATPYGDNSGTALLYDATSNRLDGTMIDFSLNGNENNFVDGYVYTMPLFYADADVDGFGDANDTGITASCVPAGYSANNSDCDDTNPAIHPNAIEICNAIDDNCDGTIDNITPILYYADADRDGFGSAIDGGTYFGCTVPEGYVLNNADCDDSNALTHPGAIDVCGNRIDDNCDGIVDGTVTNALNFNKQGSAAEYNVVVVPDATALDIVNGTAMTVEFWINLSVDAGTYHILGKREGCWYFNYQVAVDPNGLAFGGPFNTVSTYYRPPVNQWTHIAFSYSGTSVSFYLNGELYGVYEGAGLGEVNDWPLKIGTSGDCEGPLFGSLDEVRIWNVARSQSQITENMSGELVATDNIGLVAYYKMNQGFANSDNTTVTQLLDASTNYLNGTLLNFTLNGTSSNFVLGTGTQQPAQTYYADADGDGYGSGSPIILYCIPDTGYSLNNTDCNDADYMIYPGAIEICNGLDDDCDGLVDEDVKGPPDVQSITGPAIVCKNETNLVYAAPFVSGVTYTWVVPKDAAIVLGQNTNSITVNWGIKKGEVAVTMQSACGTGKKATVKVELGACSTVANTANVSARTASTENVSETTPVVYPNPFTNEFTIEFWSETVNDQGKVMVFDLNGVLIQAQAVRMTEGANKVQIELTRQSTGVYMVYIHNGAMIQKIRVIKGL